MRHRNNYVIFDVVTDGYRSNFIVFSILTGGI